MKKQILLIMLLLIQSLAVFIPTSVATEYIIDGDKVYIDDEYVYLSAEPHTVIQDTDVVFELISKQFTGEIDVAFGINNTNMNVKNPRLWNGTSWNPLNKEIQTVNQVHQGYDRWHLLKNVNVNEDVLYKLKLTVDIIFNTSGKYFFGVKRSIDSISQGYYIDPWWDSSWYNMVSISIDNSYIDNDLVNFTVLVPITSTIASSCQSNGEDIRFVASDNTTEYYYEIDLWNGSGTSYAWVKIPRIESGSVTQFNMYYNNGVATDNQDSNNTWDENYTAVWHMTNLTDSTINGYVLNNNGANPEDDGIVSGCYYFNSGQSDSVDNITLFNTFPTQATFECWYRPYSILGNVQFLMSKTITAAEDYIYLRLNANSDNKVRLSGEGGNNGEKEIASGAGWPIADVWQYTAGVYVANGQLKLYCNTTGYTDTEDCQTIQSGVGSAFRMGTRSQGGYPYGGRIDEARVSNVMRNASWLKASFHTVNQTTGFLLMGEEVEQPDTPDSPTGFNANTTNNTGIFLNWTMGINTTHTYLVRKTGSYPINRADGTNIYNDTGVNYSDSGLTISTVYYYGAWGYNSTTGNWSLSTFATNHTGAANPTSVNADVGTGYINITWNNGARAYTTRLVHNATAYPTNPLVFSWNDTVQLFSSGYQVQYGSLTVRVYDENTSNAIVNWTIFITNLSGSQTYERASNTNPLVINLADLPQGLDTAIKINATGYDFRLYYMDIYPSVEYTLDAYLSPMNMMRILAL